MGTRVKAHEGGLGIVRLVEEIGKTMLPPWSMVVEGRGGMGMCNEVIGKKEVYWGELLRNEHH